MLVKEREKLNMGKNYSDADKARLIQEYRESNETMRKFGLDNNVPPSTLATWLYNNKDNKTFGVVNIKEKNKLENECIVFKNSFITIELKAGYDKVFLKNLLQVITND